MDGTGNVYVVGATESSDFPTQAALQPTPTFNGDAFLTAIADLAATDPSAPGRKLFSNVGFRQQGIYLGFQMDILVPPLFHYQLERSRDLVTWELETLFQADTDGTFHYSDIFASSYSQKFYRVMLNTNF